jgi:hypothetical protein
MGIGDRLRSYVEALCAVCLYMFQKRCARVVRRNERKVPQICCMRSLLSHRAMERAGRSSSQRDGGL